MNPKLSTRACAVVYNPLRESVTRKIRFPLYYTGLQNKVRVTYADSDATLNAELQRDHSLELSVTIPGRRWRIIFFSMPND